MTGCAASRDGMSLTHTVTLHLGTESSPAWLIFPRRRGTRYKFNELRFTPCTSARAASFRYFINWL